MNTPNNKKKCVVCGKSFDWGGDAATCTAHCKKEMQESSKISSLQKRDRQWELARKWIESQVAWDIELEKRRCPEYRKMKREHTTTRCREYNRQIAKNKNTKKLNAIIGLFKGEKCE